MVRNIGGTLNLVGVNGDLGPPLMKSASLALCSFPAGSIPLCPMPPSPVPPVSTLYTMWIPGRV